MDHLEPLRQRIRSMPVFVPSSPWKTIGQYAAGQLTEVGFADDSEYLLVVSSSGRGVYDCKTGERLARDYTEPDDSWHDVRGLCAAGIGPLDKKVVRVAGLIGGGLANSGRDGWWVEAVPIDWPDTSLLLGGPGGWLYDNETSFAKLGIEREVRAFGFSPSGEVVVLATSSDLLLLRWSG